LWNVNVDYDRNAWTASAFMTNVTNQTYLTDGGSTTSVYYGSPRQVGLRVSRKF
jgi:outer membrane receptor protein involved in Fe transport